MKNTVKIIIIPKNINEQIFIRNNKTIQKVYKYEIIKKKCMNREINNLLSQHFKKIL